jgi:hypothetical protein
MRKILFALFLLLASNAPGSSLNFAIVTAGDMSGAITSSPVRMDQTSSLSIQAVFTGSPAGSFKVQISNDDASPTNWSDYANSTVTISGAGNQAWDIWAVAAKWVRLIYTPSGGSGTLNARANSRIGK